MGNYVGLDRKAHCNRNGPCKREKSDSEKEKQRPEDQRKRDLKILCCLKRRKEP